MKKTVCITILGMMLFCIFSCDDDWRHDDAPMNNMGNLENIQFLDYETLPAASFPAMNNYFSPKNPAHGFLEGWLNANYFTMDVGSTATVIYDFMDYDRADSLDYLSQELTIIQSADYRSIWGTPFVEAFTPAKPAQTEIPKILKNNNPDAVDGDYKIVQYNHSAVEPTINQDVAVVYYNEDFNRFSPLGIWGNFEIPGIYKNSFDSFGRIWQIYVRDGIVGMLGYLNGVKGGNTWFVTYELDLTAGIAPLFQFDLAIGYYQGRDYLNVLATENFDGIDPRQSTWTDLTDEFGMENVPTVTGYPPLANVRTLQVNLERYAGKKIYLAFQCVLPVKESNYTDAALYVIDNVKLSETRDIASIPSSEVLYKVFKFTQNNWTALNSIYTLQPADYQQIGHTTLTVEQAREYIPSILSAKIHDAQEGDEKVVIYKQSEDIVLAENYVYTGGGWEYEKLPPIEKRTDKFIYTSLQEKWKYVTP